MEFSDQNIQRLFGNEAAEDEDFKRLQSYYIKSVTHEKVSSELPLRILVGHKGIGKSAIFKILISELQEKSKLAILIRPDDIASLGRENGDFLQVIRDWKSGLMQIIAKKVFESFGDNIDDEKLRKGVSAGMKLTNFIVEVFDGKIKDSVDLAPAHDKVIRQYLKDRQVFIFIDDLDRGWQSTREDITRVSALLNAVRDLCSDNEGLFFKIALRTDVYYLVRSSDESTDKIEGSVVWHSWTNHELLLLLVKRIKTFLGEPIEIDEIKEQEQRVIAYHIESVFDKTFYGSGKWSRVPTYRVLMSLIRKRPRDLVKLCTLAAKNANDKKYDKIRTDSLQGIFEVYSQGRIQDTINEYKSELPDIERLLLNMKPNRRQVKTSKMYIYTTNELKNKIKTIIERGKFIYANGKEAKSDDLAQFLYKINFITARKEEKSGLIDRKYFEENRYLSSNIVDFGYDWEIHPAFRWALQVNNLSDIFNDLALSGDDR